MMYEDLYMMRGAGHQMGNYLLHTEGLQPESFIAR